MAAVLGLWARYLQYWVYGHDICSTGSAGTISAALETMGAIAAALGLRAR